MCPNKQALRRALTLIAIIPLISLLACDLDDAGEDDEAQDVITAYDDFLKADACVAEGTFSTALLHYGDAIAKLTDDDPENDGPDPAMTLDRSRYGAAVCFTLVPMRILERFVQSFIAGDTAAITEFIVEDYQRRSGKSAEDPPTNLLTIYLNEWIVPELANADAHLDAVLANPDFYYEMPAIRLVLFGRAITLPDMADSVGRGRHDLVEASLLSGVLHAVEWLLRSLLSYNIDIDIVKIDEILWLIRSGDLGALLGMIEQYPHLLTPSTVESNGVDGQGMLIGAYENFAAALLRFRDDDDYDGRWSVFSDDGAVDGGERADDLMDALRLDDSIQMFDVVLRTERGLGLNVRVNGASLRGSFTEVLINLVLNGLLSDAVCARLHRTVLGLDPPEGNALNGIDDDFALGTVSLVEPGRLADAGAPFLPHTLAGWMLNPDVAQGEDDLPFAQYLIVDNTATELHVIGDPSEVAAPGDTYAIGDGIVDDEPLSFGFLLPLLGIEDWPDGTGLGFFYGAFFAPIPNMREIVPAWSSEYGNPDFYGFVVDRTESYEDVDGNGRYDPGVDVLFDADHAYDGFYFPADERYQPYYAYFGDPRWGGILHYARFVPPEDLNNLVNLLISRVLTLVMGDGQGGGR